MNDIKHKAHEWLDEVANGYFGDDRDQWIFPSRDLVDEMLIAILPGTCEDCKFWSTDTEHHPLRACHKTPNIIGRKKDELEGNHLNAYASFGDYYESWLISGKDFSCSHWERKEREDE